MKEKLIPLILGFVLLFSIGLINTNSSTQSIQYVRQANSAIILNPENNFWYNEYLWMDLDPEGRIWESASLEGSAILFA